MRCLFNGVGEAFDAHLPNCSVWLETHPGGVKRTLLLDCGFTAPFALFRHLPEKEALDTDLIWISHFHGDHYLGLPALLLRFHESGRTKPLTIVGQEGIEERTCEAMDMAYAGVRKRFAFDVTFLDAFPGATLLPLGLAMETAWSDHSQPNLSVKVNDGRHSVFYSGDGRPTRQSLHLAKGADLIVHESFSLEHDTHGHGTVPGSIDFARHAACNLLALVHLRRDIRHQHAADVLDIMQSTNDVQVLLPEPGALLEI